MSEDQNWTTSVFGTHPGVLPDPHLAGDRGEPSHAGRTSTAANKVAVLGQTVADKLFGPSANPVGQVVRVKNIPFIGGGRPREEGPVASTGQDYDDALIVPVTTFQQKIQGGLKNVHRRQHRWSSATGADTTARARDARSAGLLRDRHHLRAGADDDFSIRNLSEIASAQQEGTRTLTTLLAAIAAVSLLVGGIGIMNIMLVSVTERTREIGLRMAVGAKPADIRLQFLVEALTLAVTGGLIGVALGLAVRLAARDELRLGGPLPPGRRRASRSASAALVGRGLRPLPGPQGFPARPHPGPEVRMRGPHPGERTCASGSSALSGRSCGGGTGFGVAAGHGLAAAGGDEGPRRVLSLSQSAGPTPPSRALTSGLGPY